MNNENENENVDKAEGPSISAPFIAVPGATYPIRPEHSLHLVLPHVVSMSCNILGKKPPKEVQDIWDKQLTKEGIQEVVDFFNKFFAATIQPEESPLLKLKELGWFDLDTYELVVISFVAFTNILTYYKDMDRDAGTTPMDSPLKLEDLIQEIKDRVFRST